MEEPKEREDSNKRKLEEDIQLAKQKAQEIVAKLVSDAESKRPRFDFESSEPAPAHSNSSVSNPPFPVSFAAQTGQYHALQSSSKKISVPNGKVGLIIGKGGETIKYLQLQSGAKIQITKDTEADPYAMTRDVELVGTPEQISRAEQFVNDVLSQGDSGVSAPSANHGTNSMQPGVEHFIMKVPNNKVALLIGKGGETIKHIQSRSGAHIQIIPLHLPPGDTSTERNVHINGLTEQIDSAKELINDVINGKRLINPSGANPYMQPTYAPTANWAQAGQPPLQQQPQYAYTQAGSYQTPQAPPYYTNYPTQASNWDHSNQSTISQPSQQSIGYEYYNQQVPGGSNQTYSHGYDQHYSHQPLNYEQNISTHASSFDQHEPYVNSGCGPSGAPSEPDGTSSSQSTQPSSGYSLGYSQSMVNHPQAVYWTYPSSTVQPGPQTGYDQGVHSQTFQPEYGQVGYSQSAPPPANGELPQQQQQTLSVAAANGFSELSGYGVDQTGEGNSGGDHGSVPVVKETGGSLS